MMSFDLVLSFEFVGGNVELVGGQDGSLGRDCVIMLVDQFLGIDSLGRNRTLLPANRILMMWKTNKCFGK